LNFGVNLLLNFSLQMPRRSGVFHCMETATKQMAFSLRYVTRKIVVNLQLIWGKERIFLLVWGEGSWNEIWFSFHVNLDIYSLMIYITPLNMQLTQSWYERHGNKYYQFIPYDLWFFFIFYINLES
jgi:hypothetical protein